MEDIKKSKEKEVKRKKKNISVSKIIILVLLFAIIVLLGIILFKLINGDTKKAAAKKVEQISTTYSLEAGGNIAELTVFKFLEGDEELLSAATIDISTVDINRVGNYIININCNDKLYNVTVEVKDTTKPVINLKTDTVSVYKGDSVRKEQFINDIKDIQECSVGLVKDPASATPSTIKEDILVFDEPGDYNIGIMAVDASGNYTVNEVKVIVNSIDYESILNSGHTVEIASGTDFSEFDTKLIPYGFSTTDRDELNRPNGCFYYKTKYGKYAADYIQPESNYVYLTFDDGYEAGTTEAFLDTLKEKNCKAVFFLTLPYAKDNPELVKRMIDEGHVIGNHTSTHPAGGLQQYSVEDQIKDITQVTDYMKENYNYDMYLFRFPEGACSEQSLAIVTSLGYRAVFWSYAYRDWVVDDQPPVDESLQNAINSIHPGEIFLLHAESSTNAEMLGDLIDAIREKGFEPGYYARMDY